MNIIAYYISLLHHYYLLLPVLLRIIPLILHHYYIIITYYYGSIITYYYVIQNLLLRISTRSVIGNNRPIITYYGPVDFADVREPAEKSEGGVHAVREICHTTSRASEFVELRSTGTRALFRRLI